MCDMTSVCVASSNERPFTSKISSPTSRSALSAGDPVTNQSLLSDINTTTKIQCIDIQLTIHWCMQSSKFV